VRPLDGALTRSIEIQTLSSFCQSSLMTLLVVGFTLWKSMRGKATSQQPLRWILLEQAK
jgi:hypothetical protein